MIKKILQFITRFLLTSAKTETGNPVKHNIKHIERAKGVDHKLLNIIKIVSQEIPLIVLPFGGVRTLKQQKNLVKIGVSKTLKSKHLTGKAIDVAPYYNKKIDWKATEDFAYMCGMIRIVAKYQGVKIRQGCLWNKKSIKENKFGDYPHQEI
jgi:peptidoglycan L-alanyl-D-glutamate endopeptidase CwlK